MDTVAPTSTLRSVTDHPSGDAVSLEAEGFFKVYEEYSKTLRTWLVAFGIGGPVLFLTNEAIARRLAQSGYSTWIAGLFLTGVALQVALAAINKHAMWACYIATSKPDHDHNRFIRFGEWMSAQYWIDFIVDALSLIVFSVAVVWAFRVLIAVA